MVLIKIKNISPILWGPSISSAWRFPVREIYLRCDGGEKDYLTEIQIPLRPVH